MSVVLFSVCLNGFIIFRKLNNEVRCGGSPLSFQHFGGAKAEGLLEDQPGQHSKILSLQTIYKTSFNLKMINNENLQRNTLKSSQLLWPFFATMLFL